MELHKFSPIPETPSILQVILQDFQPLTVQLRDAISPSEQANISSFSQIIILANALFANF